ncbi:hypothetical protein D3C80_2156270 [compost metagenome]
MAAHRFVQYDLLFAASGRHHHGAAGHQATQQPVGEGLQVVAIEIDGYEAEDDHEPDGELPDNACEAAAASRQNADG